MDMVDGLQTIRYPAAGCIGYDRHRSVIHLVDSAYWKTN